MFSLSHTHTYTHTRTHSHIHTHTCTYAHTQTRKHVQSHAEDTVWMVGRHPGNTKRLGVVHCNTIQYNILAGEKFGKIDNFNHLNGENVVALEYP